MLDPALIKVMGTVGSVRFESRTIRVKTFSDALGIFRIGKTH